MYCGHDMSSELMPECHLRTVKLDPFPSHVMISCSTPELEVLEHISLSCDV